MSFLLTDEFEDSFEWEGKVYHVDLAFDNVLRLFEMFDDDVFFEEEKPFLAITMLVVEEISNFQSLEEGFELFKFLMKEFLDINLEEQGEKKKKIYDFKKDADLIYASFLACYKIDLFEMHGKLHWKKFNALLAHLDDKSKLKQVIGYREMKVPNSKEASREYIDHVQKMKRLYSLDDRPAAEQIDSAFDALAHTFRANAKVVKKDG